MTNVAGFFIRISYSLCQLAISFQFAQVGACLRVAFVDVRRQGPSI